MRIESGIFDQPQTIQVRVTASYLHNRRILNYIWNRCSLFPLLFQNDLKKVNIIGWIIFSLVLFTLYKSVMVVIYTVIIKFYQRFKRWLRVKLNYKMWEHKNMKILQKRKRQKLRDKRLRESIGKKNNYNSIFTNLFRIL